MVTPPLPLAATLSDCPLCNRAAITERGPAGEYAITCSHCGEFEVTDTAYVMVKSLPSRFHVALSQAAHVSTQSGTTMLISMQNVAQLVSPYL